MSGNAKKILTIEDPRLYKECASVQQHEFLLTNIDNVVKYLKATLRARGGVGLAAPQIGINRRIFILDRAVAFPDEPLRSHQKFIVAINPEIMVQDGTETKYREGCLSAPDMYGYVKRPRAVSLYCYDEKAEQHIYGLEGFGAVAAQHENDHLDGIMFLDRMSDIARDRAMKKNLKKQKKVYRAHKNRGW